MRVRKLIILSLLGFVLLSPALSTTLKALTDGDSAGVDSATPAVAEEIESQPRPLVFTMTIEGAIGTVTNDRIAEALSDASDEGAEMLVIYLDTPGGFTKPTWTICKQFLNSPVPVCIYIAPSGARAGSAGVYMAYAAHFAAMAHSTNIGAAHPVLGTGQEVDSVMNEKMTNDAVAQIRAAAEKRGRNADWAEAAVRHSVSITDSAALAMNVVDFRAENLTALLEQIDGRTTELPDGDHVMRVKRARVKDIETSLIHRILEVVTSPDIAFILFSIGGLGIMLELYNPGSILPGVVGAISLILAFYAFQTLPINYAGLALILLAVILFIAEIKVISHGILTIGGLIAFFLGGLMLVDTVDPNLRISMSVLVTMVVFAAVVVGVCAYLVIKAHRHRPVGGVEGMIGKSAEVRDHGFVYVDGALWKARSADGAPLEIGGTVEIVAVDKLTLTVKKANA